MNYQSTLKVGRRYAVALFFLLFSFLLTYSQQTLTTINGWNAYVHLPDDYNTTGAHKYPAIIFFPGTGECGTNPTLMFNYGPPHFINLGFNLDSFHVNGITIKPIIVSLQPPFLYPQPWLLNIMFDSVLARYRIDPNLINLTGLSMGGFCGDNFVTSSPANAARINSMVEMSAVVPNYPITNYSYYALSGGKVWWFEGTLDNRGMNVMADTMNKYVPGSARYSSYVGGHCCWNNEYNPAYTENVNGQTWNIYQWMLAQNKTDLPPVANAGSNITVFLPVDTANLNGTSSSDPDGFIASYSWAKVSGPAQITMADTNTATPVISNLTSGLYTFKLTVTDNLGVSSNAQVQVLTTFGTLPLDFISFSGKNAGDNNILTWETSSTDLDQGNFELERSSSRSAFRMISSTPTQDKSTGSHSYSYEDMNVPDIVSFYRIKYTSFSGVVKYSEILQIKKNQEGVNFSYYPNPVSDHVVVQLQSQEKGPVLIRLIALDGRVIYQQQDFKSEDTYLKNISLGNISPGMYFISYSIGDNFHNVGKIIRE
jgi:hypothetical protein